MGAVELEVFHGKDRQSGRWTCPVRELWGLAPHQQLSPALLDRLCYTATETGSYEKAQRMAAKWGVEVDDSTIHAQVQRAGARATRVRASPD